LWWRRKKLKPREGGVRWVGRLRESDRQALRVGRGEATYQAVFLEMFGVSDILLQCQSEEDSNVAFGGTVFSGACLWRCIMSI
jgi:hypothetical protein